MDDVAASHVVELSAIGWRIAATIFVVLANGFFVAAEFALVKVRGTQLQSRAESGSAAARVAYHIYGHLNRYLSACQLGITLSSLILGWLAEPAVAELLIYIAHAVGLSIAPNLLHGIALVLALSVVTILHMTVGEQVPKLWAIHRAEQTSLQVAYPLRWFAALFRPFIWVIDEVSTGALRLAGLSASELEEHGSHSADEIRRILARSAETGEISRRQLEFAKNVLDMVALEVRHILVPRVDVVYLSMARSDAANLEAIRTSGHSRLPLCETDLDQVVGVVHAKDVLAALATDPNPDLKALARKASFVADTQPLPKLIQEFQRHGSHSAVVVDEHGTAVGLAFLEDALEEIVGPIRDEFDAAGSDIVVEPGGAVEMIGSVALPEAAEVLDLDEIEVEADTISGLIVSLLGRLAKRGDQIQLGRYRAIVLTASRRRIERLRFEPLSSDSHTDRSCDGAVTGPSPGPVPPDLPETP